ncbi:MAG: tyrosine-type recombinase/integrase [Streptosporangiaceae bacterium]
MGNVKGRRRRFGAVRVLASGQWQARYRGTDGIMRPAPHTFPTKAEAERWLTRTEAEILDDDWINPDNGLVTFGEYATAWIEERPGLRPSTIEVYRYLLIRHLLPTLGSRPVAEIRDAQVRRWRKKLIDSGASAASAAKTYRLLRAIMNTAVDDGIIRRNPCRVRGAGQDRSPERQVLTVSQVYALADAVGERYRALILLAVFGSLRWGELAALRRMDIDITTRSVTVHRSLTELPGGGYHFGPTKSAAGQRVVAIPDSIKRDVASHLVRFTAPGDDSLVFTSPTGAPLRHGNFRRRIWLPALASTGLPGTHFHDLRHTGNTLMAGAGANLRELMERMGHSSTRAALIYLHATSERHRKLADAVGNAARRELRDTVRQTRHAAGSGTDVARRRGDKQK